MSSFGDSDPRTELEQYVRSLQESHQLTDRDVVSMLVDVTQYFLKTSPDFPKSDF